jgi:hypothetical protein
MEEEGKLESVQLRHPAGKCTEGGKCAKGRQHTARRINKARRIKQGNKA